MTKKHILLLPALIYGLFLSAQGVFTKVTDTSNPVVTFANNPANYKGCAWIDLNGDNLPDLFSAPRFRVCLKIFH